MRPSPHSLALLAMLTQAPLVARADAPKKGAPPEAEAPAAQAPATVGYTLKQCLSLADGNHPNIAAARAKVDQYRAQLDEAHTAPFSNFSVTAGVGPAPTFRGGQIYSPDQATIVGLNNSFGMGWRASFDGTVPLWTFGKITNLWRAAEAQVAVGEGEAAKARNAVRFDVRKAYHGLQLAREARSLLGEATSRLDKVLGPLKKKVDEGEGDEIDLLRLQTTRSELDARVAEAEKGERVALLALRFYTGVESLDIAPLPLRPPKHELRAVNDYLDAARQHRPELKMARAGMAARTAQADLARSRLLPDLGLTLTAGYGRAPEITDQLNPFVNDSANYLYYGFAVGMRWQLDFLPGSARVRQADKVLEEMSHTLRYAIGGIALEVEKAHADATETRKKVDAYKNAARFARQWMIKVAQGIDVGIFEERDLVDPARQYALQRFAYLSALMDHNMAMANLAMVTGWDEVAEPLELAPPRCYASVRSMKHPTTLAPLLAALTALAIAPLAHADRVNVKGGPPPSASAKGKPGEARSIGFPNAGKLENGQAWRDTRSARRSDAKGPEGAFAMPQLIGFLHHAAQKVARRFPRSMMVVGDLSARHGGPLVGHQSHQNGRDVDVGFYVVNEHGKPLNLDRFLPFDGEGKAEGGRVRFDDARNWALVEAMLTDPKVEVRAVFVATWLKVRLLKHAEQAHAPKALVEKAASVMMQPPNSEPHHDHFHVRIACPSSQRGTCHDDSAM